MINLVDAASHFTRRGAIGAACARFAGSVGVAPNPSAWEQALKAYSAARQGHETFLASVLQPAYALVAEEFARSPAGNLPGTAPLEVPQIRRRIAAAERSVREAGGGRPEVLVLRATNSEHANLRSMLARYLRSRRTRARLMRQHRVFALEERGNDLRDATSKALINLLTTPALDAAGLLLKARASYEEIFRHEDHEGLLGAVFADVERLLTENSTI